MGKNLHDPVSVKHSNALGVMKSLSHRTLITFPLPLIANTPSIVSLYTAGNIVSAFSLNRGTPI